MIALLGALLTAGCGGDDEPSRAAEPAKTSSTTTKPAKPTEKSTATQAERAPHKSGDDAAPTSTTPKKGSKKKANRRDSGGAKPRTLAPRTTPGTDAEALEAEDKAREGGVPILGNPPDR